MPDVAKLKKKAAEFELKKQFDKALAVYVEILDGFDASDEEVDVSLFNRVGDLYLKQGSVGDAVDYYEQAVDRYAEGGFHNNAIALCNKILRNSPGRASVYYKLGKISAQKGFKGDAKKNFLEYADRMQSSGKIDEAFRALKEFADLCPDQDDIRLMLAEQLSKQGRTAEAIEQLQLLYIRYSHEGRDVEARATVERMKAIDPSSEPRALGEAPSRSAADLVFLDLNDNAPNKRASHAAKRATHGLNIIETGETPLVPPEPTRGAEFDRSGNFEGGGGLLAGLEPTSFAAPETSADVELEAIELDEPKHPRTHRPSLAGLPLLADEKGEAPARRDETSELGGELHLVMPDGTPIHGAPVQSGAVDESPLLDIEFTLPDEETATSAEMDEIELDPGLADVDADRAAVNRDSPEEDLTSAPPPVHGQSTMNAAQDVDLLRALCEADPDNNATRRRLAEAMLESGDREGGLRELEVAMVGFERSDDLIAASKIADEVVLLNPSSVRHHQKRVEYAFRTNERGRLIEAYLQLADALFRAGQVEKSRAIYQRVIDLSPDDPRAEAALESFPEPEVEPEPAPPPPRGRQSTAGMPRPAVPEPAARQAPSVASDEEFINLGDWLRDDEAPKDTRMVVEEKEPTGDEEADFQDMLRKFKQGISENVEEEDHQSHYDLGVAYKEMGLLDEAIAEFQKALRAPSNRVPAYEALGHCFIEKEQYPMAATVLGRALHERGISENQLVGVLYLLGRCAEERGQRDAAIEYYQRVFVVDIQFQDVGERLAAVEGASS